MALKAQESRTKLIGMKRENLVRKADRVKLSERLKRLIINCFYVNKFNNVFSTSRSVVAINPTIESHRDKTEEIPKCKNYTDLTNGSIINRWLYSGDQSTHRDKSLLACLTFQSDKLVPV